MVVLHTFKERCGVFSKSINYRRSMVDCARVYARDVGGLFFKFEGGVWVCARVV